MHRGLELFTFWRLKIQEWVVGRGLKIRLRTFFKFRGEFQMDDREILFTINGVDNLNYCFEV